MKRKIKSARLHGKDVFVPGLNALKQTVDQVSYPGVSLELDGDIVILKLKGVEAFLPITNFQSLVVEPEVAVKK